MKESITMDKRRSDNIFVPNWIFKTILTILAIGYLTVTYWLFWPYKPLVVIAPIKIHNLDRQVNPGDYLIYELSLDKKISLPATVHRQLFNNFSITYAPIHNNLPIGRKIVHIKLLIPAYAEAGEYKLKWVSEYQVNPIRKIAVEAWSEPFHVVLKQ